MRELRGHLESEYQSWDDVIFQFFCGLVDTYFNIYDLYQHFSAYPRTDHIISDYHNDRVRFRFPIGSNSQYLLLGLLFPSIKSTLVQGTVFRTALFDHVGRIH